MSAIQIVEAVILIGFTLIYCAAALRFVRNGFVWENPDPRAMRQFVEEKLSGKVLSEKPALIGTKFLVCQNGKVIEILAMPFRRRFVEQFERKLPEAVTCR